MILHYDCKVPTLLFSLLCMHRVDHMGMLGQGISRIGIVFMDIAQYPVKFIKMAQQILGETWQQTTEDCHECKVVKALYDHWKRPTPNSREAITYIDDVI